MRERESEREREGKGKRERESKEVNNKFQTQRLASILLTLLPNSIRLDRFCSDLAIKIKLLDAFSPGISRGQEQETRLAQWIRLMD